MNFTSKQKREFVKDDYNAIANLYANEDRNLKLYAPYLNKFIESLNGNKVLDVGCGAGEFSNFLASSKLEVTGVDFSVNLINIAKSRYKNVKFELSDICDFDATNKFDGIFSKDTLFHLPDSDLTQVLNKLYNLLDKNGKLCLILDIPKQDGEAIYKEPLDNNYTLYYNYLTTDKIKNLLIKANFKINKVEFISNADDLYVYADGIMVIYANK